MPEIDIDRLSRPPQPETASPESPRSCGGGSSNSQRRFFEAAMTDDKLRMGIALLVLLDGTTLRSVVLSERFVSVDALREKVLAMMRSPDPLIELDETGRAIAEARLSDAYPCWRR